MSTHVIHVKGGTASPSSEPVAAGDVVRWVGPPGSLVGIDFGATSPLEWRSNNGPTVSGTVQKVPFGPYRYRPSESLTASEPEPAASDQQPLVEPELIVSGGVQLEPKAPGRKKAAAKRARPAKRKKATKRAKPANRAKATKRKKATKRSKPARRAKSTKRAAKKR